LRQVRIFWRDLLRRDLESARLAANLAKIATNDEGFEISNAICRKLPRSQRELNRLRGEQGDFAAN